MRILFFSDNFPPEVNAPASRVFEHCRRWVQTGHEVTVVTCFPNFPQGRVYAGYRNRLWQWEECSGIRVLRVWTYMAPNAGFLRRSFDYVSFMVSACAAAVFLPRPDILVGTSPQFFTVCGAWFAAFLQRCPFIFELRDLWPESIRAVGAIRNKAILGILERVELFLYRRAAAIISVTESFKKILVARGIGADKISVVLNGVDLDRFRPGPKDPGLLDSLGLRGMFVCGYIGTHGMAHALGTVLEAARLAGKDARFADVRFLFLGDGAQKRRLQAQARQAGLGNVLFLPSVPKGEVVRYWSLLDASIVHLKKDVLFATVIPSKIFESMAMGVPVLLGVEGEAASLVMGEGVGMVFEPEDSAALLECVLKVSGDAGHRDSLRADCLAAARKYDRDVQADRMSAVLKVACDQNHGPA